MRLRSHTGAMRRLLAVFHREDAGQSLVEYTLLIAFGVCLVFGLTGYFHEALAGITALTSSNSEQRLRHPIKVATESRPAAELQYCP